MRARCLLPVVVPVVVVVVAAACSAPALPADLGRAYELEAAGDTDGAIAAFRRAQRPCADAAPT
ncbi:MAG: hypothetical protein K8M05_22415, partial [Deltaproteobacteria bacterium]|nr:hypothetical protein [Kofleriaceae bacterium]